MKIILFLIKLPFRIIALPIVIVLSILEIAANLVINMGSVLIGLFNLMLLLAAFGIMVSKNYDMLIQVGIAIGGEAVLLFLGGVIIAGVMLIRDGLWNFVTGMA